MRFRPAGGLNPAAKPDRGASEARAEVIGQKESGEAIFDQTRHENEIERAEKIVGRHGLSPRPTVNKNLNAAVSKRMPVIRKSPSALSALSALSLSRATGNRGNSGEQRGEPREPREPRGSRGAKRTTGTQGTPGVSPTARGNR